MGAVAVPLPEGEWVLAGTSERRNNLNTLLANAVLVRLENQTLKEVIGIRTNLEVNNGRRWGRISQCYRDDVHHVELIQGHSATGEECWTLNHLEFDANPSRRSHWSQAMDYLRERQVSTPNTSLISAHFITIPQRFVSVWRYYNPEAAGFAPSAQVAWSENDWHRDRVGDDQDKIAYIEARKGAAGAYQSRLSEAFE